MITNYEAEAALLGAVLIDGTLFKSLEAKEEHFYYSSHRKIYLAMAQAVEKGSFIDIVVVTSFLGDAIQEVGGTTYLLEMTESVMSTQNLKHYERLVFDAYRNRESRKEVLQYAESPSDQGLDTLINSLKTIQQLGESTEEKSTYDYLIEITDEMCDSNSQMSGFPTSFADFDAMTGGLQRGELAIIAARPSVGKTAFALNLARGHCQNNGASMVFSLEMGVKQLLQRMIASEGKINSQKWRDMAFSNEDYTRAFDAVGEISKWKLRIFDRKTTITEIRTAVRKEIHDKGDDKHLVIIDYLQLISPASQRNRRDLEIGEITRELKLLATELDIPIVLLSQLSRGVEARQNKRPMLSDLRDSGNIEQDANVISFLYRDDYYDRTSSNKDQMEIIIGKQRNGPTGAVEMVFMKEFGRFVG